MKDSFARYINQTFDNRYQIVEVIGVGGMAVVFKAIEINTGEVVAIKMLKDSLDHDQAAVRRFINESRAISMLHQENIVSIKHISDSSAHKIIVEEYIQGITLREYMNNKKPVPWREAVEFVQQILSALNHAHSKGIIHRDIKPQNIMLLPGGVVKVMDFGIAKIPKAETLTMVDKAIGTVYYLSPEQASGHKIDLRADLYSVGVLLYEMVTGTLPFVAESSVSVLMSHIREKPVPPTQINPNIPRGLEQIILRLMEKNPDDRFQSAGQVNRQLFKLKNDPLIVFVDTRPPRTATSESSISKTAYHNQSYEQNNNNNGRAKSVESEAQKAKKKSNGIPSLFDTSPDTRTQAQKPKYSRKRRGESTPFFLVILICIVFVAAAMLGLGIVFGIMLSKSSTVLSLPIVIHRFLGGGL